jgi:uncharacterized metal-binding protein YceD (DUF177 family)
MLIELDQVRREPFHWQETREVSAATLDRPELESLGEIDWRGTVELADPGFYLTGRLGYDQTLICTRCLASFTQPVEAEVELLLLVEEPPVGKAARARGDRGEREGWGERGERGEPAQTGEEMVELDEEDLGVLTLTDETFDTDPILFEQLQLNIPMKPLCRPECKGLCPICGADRNEGECSCSDSTTDPRWQALAGLKERLDRDERSG